MDDATRDRIRAKLRLLETERGPRASAEPVSPEDLAGFEATHRIRLPAGYRRFLLEFGEGGAGPGWGMMTLERWADAWSDLAEPDPLSPSRPVRDAFEAEADPARVAEQLTGFITLADQGAERWWLLEVAEPGRVWRWESFESAPEAKAPFSEWYERWLDESIAGLDDTTFGAFEPGSDTAVLLRLSDPDADVRADAAGELGRRLTPSDAVRAGLRQLMRDPAPSVRAAALRHGERAALETDVLHGLDDSEVAVKRVAAFLLRRASSPPGPEELRTRLERADDPTVLSLVGQTLGESGELPARSLNAALTDGRSALRARAVRLLEWAQPRDDADAALTRALDDADPDVRTAAVLVLASLPDGASRLRAHRDREHDPGVRAALARELEALGTT